MLDKTLFEAAACGCRVLSSSADFAELAGSASHFDTATELARALGKLFAVENDRVHKDFVTEHSLLALAERLFAVLTIEANQYPSQD